ncbi:uncharacterized protein LOC111614995 [Centruroides sculpturatus]|uniref:uncharacterized protein LOC111614995 n=1 Tax=Centruroides sculpturatus TaxID=218467 RepID=UPI000C6EB3A7|nr:uncharacterized protein LOC111614995 [Centruroides sculpturatus]
MSKDYENYEQLFWECMIYLEQCFYKWLSFLPQYQILKDNEKIRIKQKYFRRGTIMEMVERSLPVHDVLRLHKAFFDPFSYVNGDFVEFSQKILQFTIELRHFIISDEHFQVVKLQLIFKDGIIGDGKAKLTMNYMDMLEELEELMIYYEHDHHKSLNKTEKEELMQYHLVSNYSKPSLNRDFLSLDIFLSG